MPRHRSRPRNVAAIAATLCALASPAAGVDFRVSDWLLEAGTSPGPSRIEESYTAGAGTTSTRPSGSYSYRPSTHLADFAIGYERGGTLGNYGLGLTYGLDLHYAFGSVSAGAPVSASLSYARILPELRLSGFYALSSAARLQLTPLVGYGLESMQWKDTNILAGGNASGTHAILAYGLLLGARYRIAHVPHLPHGLTCGLDVGYESGRSSHRFSDALGTTSALTVTSAGIAAAASLAVRW